MGYYLVDSNGYLDDFGSIGGLKTFREWAEKQSDPIRAFIEEGESDDPQSLADALDVVSTTGDNENMRATLAEAARGAEDVLILTDGANNTLEADDDGPDDDGEFETWPTPESEIDPEALAAAEAADKADGIDDETTGFSDEQAAEAFMADNQPRDSHGRWTKGNLAAKMANTPEQHLAAAAHHREVANAGGTDDAWGLGSERSHHAAAADAHEKAATGAMSSADARAASSRAERSTVDEERRIEEANASRARAEKMSGFKKTAEESKKKALSSRAESLRQVKAMQADGFVSKKPGKAGEHEQAEMDKKWKALPKAKKAAYLKKWGMEDDGSFSDESDA